MNASAGSITTERAHELFDLGLAYIRAAIRANLAEVDSEIAAAGILHAAWSRSFPPPDSVAISVMPAYAPVVTVVCNRRVQHRPTLQQEKVMLRKLMALAATAAMLGANASAYAITSARAAVKSITGSPAADENPPRVDGRTIQPSIPEPPEPAPVARKVSAKASATKASASKPGASKTKNAKARAPKAKSARTKSRRAR